MAKKKPVRFVTLTAWQEEHCQWLYCAHDTTLIEVGDPFRFYSSFPMHDDCAVAANERRKSKS